jgi:predicted enzyme related to lactoylglutathione lyase
MTNPKGSFIWYELMTPDADGAAAFYGAVVGWKIVGAGAPGENGIDYRHIVRSDGGANGGVLALTAKMTANGAHPCWVGYLYVADIDESVAAITADGGKLLMPKTTIDVGSFAMVTDPQGVPFYIMAPIAPAGREGEPSDAYARWTPQHVSWNELYTSDLEAAKAFYAKHFDFEFNSSMPMGDMGDYCFIDHGGEGIGAVMKKPPHVPVNGWNYYIRVADIEVAKAAVETAGGKVINGPMQVPGGDWIINGMDPQGAAFALVGAKGA